MNIDRYTCSTVQALYPIGSKDPGINTEPGRMFEVTKEDGMLLAHAAELPHIKFLFPVSQYGSETDDSIHVMTSPDRSTDNGDFVNFGDLTQAELAYFGETAAKVAQMGFISGYNMSSQSNPNTCTRMFGYEKYKTIKT